MAVQEKNRRINYLDSPGVYPYIDFEQFRSGGFKREDSTTNNHSYSLGHSTGTFLEHSSDGSMHLLSTNTAHRYVRGGSTETAEDNLHEKIGASIVSQVTQDNHAEYGGNKTHAIQMDHIQVAGGQVYYHGTAGISSSSVGDLTTDHNDGNWYHNIDGDHVSFLQGTRYQYIGAEYGTYCPNGNMDFHSSGNIQFTCNNFIVNAQSIFLNVPGMGQLWINSQGITVQTENNLNITINAANVSNILAANLVYTFGNNNGTLIQGGGVQISPITVSS